MPCFRGARVAFALLAAAALGAPAAAQADSVSAPRVYVRLFSAHNNQPWVPLSATVTNMGPYELGVKVQAQPSAPENRQAIQVDLTSSMGSVPEQPFVSYCQNIVGPPGSIYALGGGGILSYTGNGAYGMNVSAYTDAQHDAFLGNSCSGGPTTPVTMTVRASTAARIDGTPIVPRVRRSAHGFAGLSVGTPVGAQGFQWRCALNPEFGADGSPTGTLLTGGRSTPAADRAALDTRAIGSTFQIAEKNAFRKPGRWGCAARALGGNAIYPHDFAATPWARTPVITVKGEYKRSNSRLALAARGRVHLTVFTTRSIASDSKGGRLTLTLERATCASVRRGTVRLHPILSARARLDPAGHAVFSFRPPGQQIFYLGRLVFGGTELILPGADVPMYLEVTQPANPHRKPVLHFVPPTAWAPCP